MEDEKLTISEWKEKYNYTDDDLDFMWEFCAEFGHSTIKMLKDQGITWRTLNLGALMTLPREYDRMVGRVIYE